MENDYEVTLIIITKIAHEQLTKSLMGRLPPFQIIPLNRPRTPSQPAAGNLYAAPAVGPVTITVTQTTTIDRSVVITDTAYNSVPVTITDFALWTSTLPTRVVSNL